MSSGSTTDSSSIISGMAGSLKASLNYRKHGMEEFDYLQSVLYDISRLINKHSLGIKMHKIYFGMFNRVVALGVQIRPCLSCLQSYDHVYPFCNHTLICFNDYP